MRQLAGLAASSGSAVPAARGLDIAAIVEHRDGADDRAALLLGAGSAARDRLGWARLPFERAAVAELRQRLAVALGDVRGPLLFGEGTAVALPAAMELAAGVAMQT